MYSAAVITVSDRSYNGERKDLSGPCVSDILRKAGYDVCIERIVPDDMELIKRVLCETVDSKAASLIVTTGGTGFSKRDITPEATIAVCERLAPGIPEAMRAKSLEITPNAILSRAQAGIRGESLIINLPGSPKGAAENLEAVLPALGHGLKMLLSEEADCAEARG